MLKLEVWAEHVTSIFNKIFKEGTFPDEWVTSNRLIDIDRQTGGGMCGENNFSCAGGTEAGVGQRNIY